MEQIHTALTAISRGGIVMYPLFLLAILATAVLLEKGFVHWRYGRMPDSLAVFLRCHDFSLGELERQILALAKRSYFGRFCRTILVHRTRPTGWIEARAAEEAKAIENTLDKGLWVLETIVTAAPLLGLLGTIAGMMQAFKLFGAHSLVDPGGVTGGVAEALIATAFGLVVALIALFGFNFFSRLKSRTLDELEQMGTRLIEYIGDQQKQELSREIA